MPKIAAYNNLEDRVPQDAFHVVKDHLVVWLCVGKDFNFFLTKTWQRADDGKVYSVYARAFHMPVAEAEGTCLCVRCFMCVYLVLDLCICSKGTDAFTFVLPEMWQRGEDGKVYDMYARAFHLPVAEAEGTEAEGTVCLGFCKIL